MQTRIPEKEKIKPPTNNLSALADSNGISASLAVLPLRLFLGISFLAAGVDKLIDPEFFNSSAPGYIGNQLNGFADRSPLGFFLRGVAVPNADIFGAMVLAGELAIGLGTLVGLFSRTAAFFGLILSLTLWLTSTWSVTPFFLGSDLPYAMGWLILLITGAHPVFSLDGQLKKGATQATLPIPPTPYPGKYHIPVPPAPQPDQRIARSRFLAVGGATLAVGAVTTVVWAYSVHKKLEAAEVIQNLPEPQSTESPTSTPVIASQITPSSASGPSSNTNAGGATAQATTTAAPTTAVAPTATKAPAVQGQVLASLNSIPTGSAKSFRVPTTGEPGILIHQANGSVSALSAVCTHEGCEVQYYTSQKVLACPCHGAVFDPSSGAVLRSPARRPLKTYKVSVDGSGNIVFLQNQG